jgi:hypothetical protein
VGGVSRRELIPILVEFSEGNYNLIAFEYEVGHLQ